MSPTEIKELTKQVELLSQNVAYLVKRQEKQEELFEEMMPIARLAMNAGVEKLDELERDGSMDFARELLGIGVRIKEGFSPQDVRQLGDAVVGILDAVRALTQPEVLRIAQDASEALEDADSVKPLGLFGMARATKSPDVQRGMAMMVEVLRRIGHGVNAMESKDGEKSSKKASLERMLGPSRRKRALGTERRLPAHVPVPVPRTAASQPLATASPAAVSTKTCVTIDGIEFCTAGHMLDASAWTKEIAAAIALAEGIEMQDGHWSLVDAARSDYLERDASPNIRRLTLITDMSTRDIYTLFPKAPGRAIARIAGCPKPVGCL